MTQLTFCLFAKKLNNCFAYSAWADEYWNSSWFKLDLSFQSSVIFINNQVYHYYTFHLVYQCEKLSHRILTKNIYFFKYAWINEVSHILLLSHMTQWVIKHLSLSLRKSEIFRSLRFHLHWDLHGIGASNIYKVHFTFLVIPSEKSWYSHFETWFCFSSPEAKPLGSTSLRHGSRY